MSKYRPLGVYLAGIPTGTHEVTLTFERIEKIIKDNLPASARRYHAWWSNEIQGSHVQAHSWMDSGWVVETLNIQDKWVRFRRKE